MRKIITLTAILLLVAGVGAAADRHGPLKTGLFEVHPGDEAPDGEKVSEGTDIIYGKYAGTSSATEQDEYREGNEAKHEKKTRGQPTFDDLEMERGVKPSATGLIDEIRDEDERSARREGNEAKHEKQAWATGGKDGGDYSASIANGHDGNVQTGKEIKIPAK